MKIRNSPSSKPARRGYAMVFVLILLSIITVFVTSSFVSARTVHDELRLIDKRQKQRIGQQPSLPNVPAKSNPQENAP